MKTILIKPNRNGQFCAYIRLAVSGERDVTGPFDVEEIDDEIRYWEDLGFNVVVSQNRFATVE